MSSPFPKNDSIGDGKEHSEAFKSDITTPEQDLAKEQRAKQLIDDIIIERLKPLEAQINAIPNVVQQTVLHILDEIQRQQPQQQAPPQQQQQSRGSQLGEVAQILGPYLQQMRDTPKEDPLLEMIKGAFSKMIQAKVDETIMGTYGVRVPPPNTIFDNKSRIQVE